MADVTQKYDTLDSLTRDICAIGFNDPEARDYIMVSRAVHRAVEQLNFIVSPPVKTVELSIEDNLTVDLPGDCVEPIKVGTIVDGIIRIMGRNDHLYTLGVTPKYTCGCQDTETTTEATTTERCDACTFHNYGNGEVYGYRPKMFPNGQYKHDPTYNRLIMGSGFDIEVGGSVVVEYISMTSADDLCLIDKRLFSCIRQRVISWLKQNANQQESRIADMHFQKEYRLAKKLMTDHYSLQDWAAAFRGERKSGLKG